MSWQQIDGEWRWVDEDDLFLDDDEDIFDEQPPRTVGRFVRAMILHGVFRAKRVLCFFGRHFWMRTDRAFIAEQKCARCSKIQIRVGGHWTDMKQ